MRTGATREVQFGIGIGGSGPDNQQQQGQAMQGAATKIDLANAAQSGKAQAALDSIENSGTKAYIGNASTVTVGDSVGVNAKEVIQLDSFAGSAAVGAVGIGGSVTIVNVGSRVDAYIGSATITAGTDASDNVSVGARLVTDIEGKAWGGQGGGVALGAQVVVINDNSQQLAHIDNGAKIQRAGEVAVEASADRDVHVQGIGLQVAGVAIGVSAAVVEVGGRRTPRSTATSGRKPACRCATCASRPTQRAPSRRTRPRSRSASASASPARSRWLTRTAWWWPRSARAATSRRRQHHGGGDGDADAEADAIAGTVSLGARMGASIALANRGPASPRASTATWSRPAPAR